jgi:hypothetical protein
VTPRRRPIFGWIAFALILVAALVVVGAVIYGYQQTQDAFVQGPPWFVVTTSVAAIPLGILCFLGLVLGAVGLGRREQPGWPAVAAVVLAIPGFGYLAVAAFTVVTVLTACSGPAGACG